MLQLAPAAKEVPHVWVWAKSPGSVPLMAIPVIVRALVPTLVKVTVCGELVVPIATVAKLRLVGESFAVVPIPLRLTFCGLPAALSEMLSAAVRVPEAVGLKVTLMLQLAPAAKEVPHVWVWAKSAALIPTIAMALMVRVAVPVFLSATIFALLLVSIACVGNVRLVGDRATIGAEVEIVLLVNFWSWPALACGSVGAGSLRRYQRLPN
jgi:hypothetical protein